MKRFILFVFAQHDVASGADDIIGSFDTLEEIILKQLEPPAVTGVFFAHILDTQTGLIKRLTAINGSTWTQTK